jgi:hypothetical protein
MNYICSCSVVLCICLYTHVFSQCRESHMFHIVLVIADWLAHNVLLNIPDPRIFLALLHVFRYGHIFSRRSYILSQVIVSWKFNCCLL